MKASDAIINQDVDESNIISSNFIEVATLKRSDVFVSTRYILITK